MNSDYLMSQRKYAYSAIAITILLSGCSIASPITPAASSPSVFDDAVFTGEIEQMADPTPGEEQYRVFNQAATGFVPMYAIRRNAEKRAGEFCQNKGRTVRLVQERKSVPPYMLGNFPRIEWVFECIQG